MVPSIVPSWLRMRMSQCSSAMATCKVCIPAFEIQLDVLTLLIRSASFSSIVARRGNNQETRCHGPLRRGPAASSTDDYSTRGIILFYQLTDLF